MNILIVTSLYPGYKDEPKCTVPYVIHYFAKEWKKQGHDVKVINTKAKYPSIFNIFSKIKIKNHYKELYKYNNEGIMVYRVPITTYPRLGNFRTENKKNLEFIEKEFEQEKFCPDVIVEHMLTPALFMVDDLKKVYDTPVVLCIHKGDFLFLENKICFKKFEKISNYVDAYAFRNEGLKRDFTKKYNNFLKGKKSFIARSGIQSDEIIKYRKEICNNKEIKISVISSFIKRKNVDSIIDAIYKLKQNNYNVILNIMGTGEEELNLKKQVSDLELEDSINFMGEVSREEVMSKLEESDIFALISKDETLGMVYLEAMSKGCLTIGSRNEGIDGIIKDGENGFLCNAGDSEELYKIIEKIINMNNEERNIILNKSISTIKYFTEEDMSKEYLDYIEVIFNKIKKEKKQ